MPDEATEVQAAVLEMRRAQKSNVRKFCAFMVLMFITLMGVLAMTATATDLSKSFLMKRIEENDGL